MADTTIAAHTAETHSPFGSSLTEIVQGLFARAEINLTDDDLGSLSNGYTEGLAVLNNLCTLCDGLASLIGADEHSGALRTRGESSDLLSVLGSIADNARARVTVAGEAEVALHLRRGRHAAAYAAGVRGAA